MSIKQESPQTVSGRDPLKGGAIAVRFGKKIEWVGTSPEPHRYLAPGWIDLQVNGFAGVDFNDPHQAHEEIARAIRVLFSTGVTAFFPTVITGAPEDMESALRNLADAKARLPEGEAITGFQVEGPHISPEDGPRGAHPKRWVRRPDVHEFHRMQDAARGLIKLVTLSPEWPEAPRYIEHLTAEGVRVAIGHMNATAAQIQDAVKAGAIMSTHLGNGAHSVLPRHPNYLWDQLAEDRLSASFIVDGIHLPAAFLKVALRAKGTERSILVTDAATPAGATPGRYRLGEQEVDLTPDNRVVLAGSTRLAGSALQMDRGIENLVRLAGLTLPEAIRMSTLNPAALLHIPDRDWLEPGNRGDLVVFRFEEGRLVIEQTYVGGTRVYSAGGTTS